jgi:hypothetical protein
MWSIYLELFGIPVAIFAWILYRLIIKKKPWSEIGPDLQLAAFVSGVWALVYFFLLR